MELKKSQNLACFYLHFLLTLQSILKPLVFHHHPIIPSWACVLLRAYPGGLADTIHQLYFDELNRPVRGDLRFDNTPSNWKPIWNCSGTFLLETTGPMLISYHVFNTCIPASTPGLVLEFCLGCLVNFPIMSVCTSGSKKHTLHKDGKERYIHFITILLIKYVETKDSTSGTWFNLSISSSAWPTAPGFHPSGSLWWQLSTKTWRLGS